uniref:Flavodoxin-like domain-containing protein n=1 Tax=Proboscia inermis TaxID=420281 RepID=A0A7S0GLY9_9STRA|mmetsp:Transcript_50758/g.59273  ORF Transcript_50758/g.59273 Transcript_50758/m.59273 type:complete len:239 (+) Transcript_50758:130-846(+)|eukprot:CAMPEP_0171313896 /NCGR_PEP_ID=MMETSP0816-20121228/46764_1 /TAXON_ID=420281 /ORGANISM="Proboscia inermis, Strain CCAP1064/1" /LENGTH=238 /DNA_ID=CAMNT_0011802029 /DNA_START=54 /DNA_END=770 /DNA_ORIENTATION=-
MEIKSRCLVVYGSETNQSKNILKEIVDNWQGSDALKFASFELLQGDDAAAKFDDINASNYEFILVGTSSYGEGEAPSGFGKFLYKLQEAAVDEEKPLKGLQHAVIGFGSTFYETFQNCPRLVDKYFGEAGSRRCLERAEIDEMDEEAETKTEEWANKVAESCLQTGASGASDDPVCKWNDPEDLILMKKMGPDGYEIDNGMPDLGSSKLPIAVAVGVAVVAYYYFYVRTVDELGGDSS